MPTKIKSSREEKLDDLIKAGNDPYPRDFPNRASIKYVLDIFNEAPTALPKKEYNIAGRVMAKRDHGNNVFFDLVDQSGTIQLHYHYEPSFISGPKTMEETREEVFRCDLGDCVGISGILGANPRGEPLFKITNWTLLAKALIEPADKFHGLKDPEQKYRHRERDLLSSPETRELFRTRAEIVFEIREYLNERDFIEIECPVLQPIYGGATARPFITRHHALNQEFYLAISSELYLKRAMVGGFDRVYSFSRCFRNEGISPTHNPEFTNLEIFESCKNADDMAHFCESLIGYLWEKFDISNSPLPYLEMKLDMSSSAWPLSRSYQKDNSIAEAWELYINDMEIASGASDLNDPREQESRLRGVYFGNDDADYNPYDPNYIEALESGLLPIAGVGIGIDRLIMLLTGRTNIRDSIMFPTLRSEK